MARPDPKIARLFELHRRNVNRIVDRGSVRPMRQMYEDAIIRTQRALERQIKLGRGTSYTAQHHRIMLAQLRVGVRELTDQIGASVALKAREAQVESLRTLVSNIQQADQLAVGVAPTMALEEASVFYGVLQGVDPSLSRAYQTTMQTYGQRTINKVELELGAMLASGASTYDTVGTVTNIIQGERWRAERIVRTEVMHAYNSAHERGIIEASRSIPSLFSRWTENIDDLTGQAYDKRVAADSFALHGQIARPGGLFTMPPANLVSPKLWGTQFRFPPNRPNDRATIIPWRPEWGVPGYFYQAGRRIEVGGDESEEQIAKLFGQPMTADQRAEQEMLAKF
jgi:hypothetical protein